MDPFNLFNLGHPWAGTARSAGRVLLDLALEHGIDPNARTVARMKDVLASWDSGRMDPQGDDLHALLVCVHMIGMVEGRLRERDKIERMAAKRRSSQRPEIERLLLAGKTNGQVERATSASARTIDRVRAELKRAGLLKKPTAI